MRECSKKNEVVKMLNEFLALIQGFFSILSDVLINSPFKYLLGVFLLAMCIGLISKLKRV